MSRVVTFVARAHKWPLIAFAVYFACTLTLIHPGCQKNLVFLHKVNFPFKANFDTPERYGIAPSKARNLKIKTKDGLTLGAWHVMPNVFHEKVMPDPFSGPLPESTYDEALLQYPTVIYFHGNAANRAAPFRTSTYTDVTGRMNANILAIDYRGFGDSEGSPSEAGLVVDAEAAWDWLVAKRGGAFTEPGKDVLVMGQSLGTGIAAKLTELLVKRGTPPQGLALIAPYASIRSQLLTFRIGGFLPVLQPLLILPYIDNIFDWTLLTHFPTVSVFRSLFAKSKPHPSGFPNIVISHATDDDVIPYANSELLFDALLDTELEVGRPPFGSEDPVVHPTRADGSKVTKEQRIAQPRSTYEKDVLQEWQDKRNFMVSQIVEGKTIRDFAEVQTFRAFAGKGPGITLIRAHFGGHNTVPEGTIDIISKMTGVGGPLSKK